jgi:hypothetical protein
MVRALAAIGALVLLAACQPSDRSARFVSAEDGFSIRALDGWDHRRERGSVVFAAPEELGAGSTIVVRAVPLEASAALGRTPDGVFAATETVVQTMPGADVVALREPARHGSMRGLGFRVTYVPPGKRARYDRHHVVLVGRDRVFHLLHTAPAGQLTATAALFDGVVSTLREEA